MKVAGLTALLVLCVALVAGREDFSVLKDFNLVKAAGFWYEIAFACKPQNLTPELRKMGIVLVELDEGQLALTIAYEDENRCVKKKSLALKGDAPGTFKLPKTSEKEVSTVYTNYETYAIMEEIQYQGERGRRVLKLYSRSLDHNEEALRRLQEVAEKYEFTPWDIHLLSLTWECAKLLKQVSLH